MSKFYEEIKRHLPPYLSPEQKKDLFKELKSFPESFNYYTSKYQSEILQGDCWKSGFSIIDFENMQKKQVKAVILSNTCDISEENKRAIPQKVVFAPLINFNQYIQILQQNGISSIELDAKINSIKHQEVTSIFYLPQGGKLESNYIICLDDLHSIPLKAAQMTEKLFTFSQQGYYLFLLKLSIHSCRFNDGVIRSIL